jgi:hypothetical protein
VISSAAQQSGGGSVPSVRQVAPGSGLSVGQGRVKRGTSGQIGLGVDRGRGWAGVAQELRDVLQARAGVEGAARRGVPQPVGMDRAETGASLAKGAAARTNTARAEV